MLAIFAAIFLIWTIDSGRIASQADQPPVVTDASELKSLPNPDQSTFSKIFGAIIKPFSK